MTIRLNHVFIDTIPDELEEDILYVSIKFRVIMHSCYCGCKNKVVTPLSPARWNMTFDGKSISLSPSIGNWNFDCKSHYWIRNSEVEWAEKWTETEIKEGKSFEREKREEYYQKTNKVQEEAIDMKSIEVSDNLDTKQSLFIKILNFFKS